MTWQSIDRYREQFDPMPSAATVRKWIRKGMLEKKQPGGPGSAVYVRERPAQNDTVQDQMRAALK